MSELAPSLDPEQLHAWFLALDERVRVLRRQVTEKQAELASEEEQLTLVRRLVELRNGKKGPTVATNEAKTSTGSRKTSASHDLELAVEHILRDAGSPLHISTIRAQLVERGVPIPGRGDDANIIVRISQLEDRFTRTARGTYGLAEWGMAALPRVTRGKRAKSRRK
jgi:hypothetical protein